MNSFVSFVFLSLVKIIQSHCRCYENWSSCTPQTAFATGILWKTCADYCRKCKEIAGGHCVNIYNKKCNGEYQCQCTGGSHAKSRNPLDIATAFWDYDS